jgi:hypothetical protein
VRPTGMLPVLLHNGNFAARGSGLQTRWAHRLKAYVRLHALVLAPALDEFNLVPFRGIDEGDFTATA